MIFNKNQGCPDAEVGSEKSSLLNRLVKRPFCNSFDSDIREIVGIASVAFVIKVVAAGSAFIFNVILARLLGAEGTGIYFLALSIVTVATLFGRMGLDNVLLRQIAAESASEKWGVVKDVYGKGMKLALLASVLSTFVLLVFSSQISELIFRKPELTPPLQWMSIAVIPWTLSKLHAEAIKGLKHISAAVFIQSAAVPIFSLAIISVFVHLWGINGAAIARALAVTCAMVCGILLWRRFTAHLKGHQGYFGIRPLVRSSTPLFWIASMNLLMNWTSVFFLGIWGTSTELGIYSIALRSAALTSFVLFAVNSIAAPKFAALYRQGMMDALERTARNSAKLMALMASPLLFLFVLTPQWVMRLFGPSFISGDNVLTILAVGQFINVATGSVGYLLMMCGYERLMRNIVSITAITNVTLNVCLIPYFGIIGAAFATAISLAMQNLIAAWMVWRYMKIQTIPLGIFYFFSGTKRK